MQPITYENLRNFAYSNDAEIKPGADGRTVIRGLMISFMGLGGQGMYDGPCDNSDELAALGIVYVRPYLNPWAWMNDTAVRTADRLIDVIRGHYGLAELPVVSSGSSMGGHAALLFSKLSRQKIIGCVTCCPVCDLVYHYGERPDVARTVLSSYEADTDGGNLMEVLAARSPLQIAAELPDVPYVFFHTDADRAVSKGAHSDRLVAALRELGREVKYYEVPGLGHCELPPELAERYNQEIIDLIGTRRTCS